MTSDVPALPSRWELRRLKFAADLVVRKATDRTLPYVGLEQIESFTGRLVAMEGNETADADTANEFAAGDVLFGKLRPYLAKVFSATQRGRCTSEALVLRPKADRLGPRYLSYVMLSEPFLALVNASTYGAKMPRASWSFIGNIGVPQPGPSEQAAIADFLDRKTAAIDALIERKERLIALLQEKRQALITQAVTKGLDPNVPMKSSGIEWLGEIPAHWEVWTVRNLIRAGELIVQDGNHGELHPTAADYVDDGVPFLMANNVRDGRLLLDDVKRIPLSLARRLRIGFARSGDVLLTHKGTVGETAFLQDTSPWPFLMLTPQVTYYRSRERRLARSFLSLAFTSEAITEQLRVVASRQSTRAYVGITAQRELLLPMPPVAEQQRIAAAIEPEARRIATLVDKVRDSQRLLREQRQAVITAAVTGKLDVSAETLEDAR